MEKKTKSYFIFGALISLLVCLLIIVSQYYSSKIEIRLYENILQLNEIKNKILHFDEILTMSSRMASFTGDKSWEDRYKKYEELLNNNIKRAIVLAPNSVTGDSARLTEEANEFLVLIENQSFQLVRDNKLKEAQALLFSDAYKKNKKQYSDGMMEFEEKINAKAYDYKSQMHKISNFVTVVSFVLIAALAFIWHTLFQNFKNYRQSLLIAQQASDLHRNKLASLGEMAGQIAHEMNTPLAGILLTAETLEKKVEEDNYSKESFLKNLAMMIKVTHKLARIVDNVRKLSKGSGERELVLCNVFELIEDTLIVMEGRFTKHGIDHRLVFNAEKKLALKVVPTEIQQVLFNVINNAIDAVKANDDERWLGFEVTKEGKSLKIAIKDNGAGVPVDIRDKIFSPKFTTKSLEEGTGIGLALSVQIMENHGGKIYLDTSCANTSFVLELPIEHNT